jgi:hypothetical protein
MNPTLEDPMPRHLLFLFCLSLCISGAPAHAAQPIVEKVTKATKAAPKKKTQSHTGRVTSLRPLAVAFVVDQSGSNRHIMPGGDGEESKATFIAKLVNKNLGAMAAASEDGESADTGELKFKGYFHLLGIGYSNEPRPLIGNSIELLPIQKLVEHGKWVMPNGDPVRTQEDYRTARMEWVQPVHQNATHMGEGLAEALSPLRKWMKENPKALAPVVMHFSDGEPEGGAGNHMQVAKELQALKTKDGNLVLMNIHVGLSGGQHMFLNRAQLQKAREEASPEEARSLKRQFEMSSPMPASMIARAREAFPEFEIHDDARAMVVNASGTMLAKVLEMGTIANQQR